MPKKIIYKLIQKKEKKKKKTQMDLWKKQ